MAGINTSISIVDRATQALRRIITASDRVTDSLNRANRTTQTAFENSHVSEFETELTDAANASNEVAESANETSSAIDRIAASVENAVAGINELVSRMDEASGSTRNTNEEAKKLSPEYKKAAEDAGNLNDVLGKVLSTALLIKGVNFAKDWISGSVDLANTQQKVEQQLKNVLRNTIEVPEIVDVVTQTRINEAVNRSTDTKINEVVNRSNNIINSVQDNVTENYVRNVDTVYSEIEQPELEDLLVTVNADTSPVDEAFERLKAKASQLQSVTIYGDEAFLAGAAELSTYIQDTDALMVALDTLANYAAGMSGGAELDTNAMTDYATQLGKVFMGAYDGIKKKGFELTDVQKEVIERGNDMQKALILSQVINESWDGLAEDMAKLPSGQVVQFKNAWGDVSVENRLPRAG